jgi:hypothetical protein
MTVGEESEVADFDKAVGQDMQQEPVDKLDSILDLSPKLRQTVKTHFSLNGELSHGSRTTEVHEGV